MLCVWKCSRFVVCFCRSCRCHTSTFPPHPYWSKTRQSVENDLSKGVVFWVSKCCRFFVCFSRFFKCHTSTWNHPRSIDQRQGKMSKMVYLRVSCFVFQNILDLLFVFPGPSTVIHLPPPTPALFIKYKGKCPKWFLLGFGTLCFKMLSIFCLFFHVLQLSYIYLQPHQTYWSKTRKSVENGLY